MGLRGTTQHGKSTSTKFKNYTCLVSDLVICIKNIFIPFDPVTLSFFFYLTGEKCLFCGIICKRKYIIGNLDVEQY